MVEKKVTVKNIETNYKVFGKGKPLLVLHGWGSNSGRWHKVAELLAEKNIMAIIPDLPGFGTTPEPASAWNLDSYVEWLNEFCEKIPELNNSFYLLGHSFGGSLSVKFTVKYTQKVKKLFLVSASCVRKVTVMKNFFYRLSKIFKIFSFVPGYQLFRKAFYKFILRKSDYPYVRGVMKDTYMKVVSEDLSWRLPFVKVPTALIWGNKDTSTPLADAKIIQGKIRNSHLVVVPGAKHSLQIEVPEILAQKVLENLPASTYYDQLLSLKNIT